MIKALLDTDICVAALKQDAAVAGLLSQLLLGEVGIASVAYAELLFGAQKSRQSEKNFARLELFVSRLELVPFDRRAAVAYAGIRSALEKQGAPIGPNDLLIAATAMSCGAELITRNVREFSRVPGLRWQTV